MSLLGNVHREIELGKKFASLSWKIPPQHWFKLGNYKLTRDKL